jgi:peptide/nickel transport system permease protein
MVDDDPNVACERRGTPRQQRRPAITTVLRFAMARMAQSLIVILIVTVLVFACAHLAPGDPFLAADDPALSSVDRDLLRAQWGYDKPVAVQYAHWLGNFAHGEFGWSHTRARPVASVLRDTLPNSLLLAAPAFVLGLLVGVALGTWEAARRDRLSARAIDTLTLIIVSIPDFVIALIVLTVIAVEWRLAPASGMSDPLNAGSASAAERVRDVAAHLILPAATVIIVVAAAVARYQRATVLSVLPADFLRTARAKGASEQRVIWRHALRNSLGPVIVIAGLLLPGLFVGVTFIEKVFGWPGVGTALVEAVSGRDYALVQGIAIIATVLVALGGALADIGAALVNPRTTIETA